MAQMREQSKTSQRALSDEEMANLSDGEFKALVIKMLIELIELGWKMEKQMKDTQNEIKQKYSGNQQRREGNQDSSQQFGTKGRNKHPTRTEWRDKNSKKWREA